MNLIFKKIIFVLNVIILLFLEMIIFIWPYKNDHYGIPFPDSGLDLDGVLAVILLELLLFCINRIELFFYKNSKPMFFVVILVDILLFYKILILFLTYKEYALYLLNSLN